MGQYSNDDLKRLFREAAEIAAEVPEAMHAAAFKVAVELLSGRPRPDTSPRTSQRRRRGHPAEVSDLANAEALSALDRTRYPKIHSDRKAIDLALLVLKAAKDDAGIDGLTPAEITKVLVDKFRVRVAESSIRMALLRAKNFVNDVPRGNAKVYRIMADGEKYIDGVA